jgi:glycosyltransferase involved in cell wall biosynthesis
MTVLSVAYPLAPVGPDAVGGSEQVLWQLDQALVAAGHTSLVVACAGSRSAGTLFAVPAVSGPIDGGVIANAWGPHRARIAQVLREHTVDLVHLHGFDFHAYLPPPGPPVLATLHLPPSWYPLPALHPKRPGTYLHCVSRSQHDACPESMHLLPPIENGVEVDRFQAYPRRAGHHALMLGRICPEKGVHLAIDAAKRADTTLLVGGKVFHYEDHDRYFETEVAPRLDDRRRLLGPLGFRWKRRLLRSARCLLVPSLADETSSLVAMEAIACGTPVIAFRRGALPDVVEHGVTGFVVDTVDEMADAIAAVDRLDPGDLERIAQERFTIDRTVQRYLAVYQAILADGREDRAERQRGAA